MVLKEINRAIEGTDFAQRVQTKVQFSERGSVIPLSVPALSQAAELGPAALGVALLHATRKAPSMAAARTALNQLLAPRQAAPRVVV